MRLLANHCAVCVNFRPGWSKCTRLLVDSPSAPMLGPTRPRVRAKSGWRPFLGGSIESCADGTDVRRKQASTGSPNDFRKTARARSVCPFLRIRFKSFARTAGGGLTEFGVGGTSVRLAPMVTQRSRRTRSGVCRADEPSPAGVGPQKATSIVATGAGGTDVRSIPRPIDRVGRQAEHSAQVAKRSSVKLQFDPAQRNSWRGS